MNACSLPFAITPLTSPAPNRCANHPARGCAISNMPAPITYLKECADHFAHSDVPPGRRSDQPVRYIYGSFYVQLAVDRPIGKDDGSFDPVTWVVIRPFLGVPALISLPAEGARGVGARPPCFQRDQAAG